jgi:hypothetical protein
MKQNNTGKMPSMIQPVDITQGDMSFLQGS